MDVRHRLTSRCRIMAHPGARDPSGATTGIALCMGCVHTLCMHGIRQTPDITPVFPAGPEPAGAHVSGPARASPAATPYTRAMDRRTLLLALAPLPFALPGRAPQASTSAPSTRYLQRPAQRPGPLPPDQPERHDPDRHLLPAEARPHPLRVRRAEGRDGHRRRQLGRGLRPEVEPQPDPLSARQDPARRCSCATGSASTEPGLVLGATHDAGGIDITVVDPRAPEAGRMVMSFAAEPDRAPPVGDHHQGRRRGPASPSTDMTTGHLARPQPLQHRARRRPLPLS